MASAPPSFAAAGLATGEDSVSQAVAGARVGLGGADASVVLVFPDGELDPDRAALAAADEAGGAQVAGLTGGGEIGPDGPVEAGCAALALGPEVACGIGMAGPASRDPRAAGRDAARAALREVGGEPGHGLFLLLLDTRSGDQHEAVAGAYEVTGPALPYVGGAAGGARAAQIVGAAALRDSAVAVVLRSPRRIGVGIAHGCSPCASPAVVTRARGRTVEHLDGRPAETVYLEKLGLGDQRPSDAEFARLATVHPLAQPELRGEVRLRHVLGRSGDGGLVCSTHMPPNAAVEFTRQTKDAIVRSTWDAVSDALAPLEGAPARAALVFDCAGRRRALGGPGPGLDAEIAALKRSFGDSRPALAGLYTRGEVGRVRGAKADWNHTVVVAAFA